MFWDEILFHELIHVFRAVSGKWKQVSLAGGLHRYTDTEEFYAVLVANIYISDKSNKIKTGLRASHEGFEPLSTDFDDPFEFFSSGMQVSSLIEQFCNDHPYFAKRLAFDLASAPFNPLSDYYADRDRAKKLSQNATPRDVVGLIEQMKGFLDKLKIF